MIDYFHSIFLTTLSTILQHLHEKKFEQKLSKLLILGVQSRFSRILAKNFHKMASLGNALFSALSHTKAGKLKVCADKCGVEFDAFKEQYK